MKRGWFAGAALSLVAALLITACGSGGGSSNKTIKVAFQDFGNKIMLNYMQSVAGQFQKQYPGDKVQLVPIDASENDYYTKLDLSQKSASTAPDVMYEDTFLINSDVASGYVKPITSDVKGWSDWKEFYPTAQSAARGQDGKIYGVPMDTDTRALYYNKSLLQQAGISLPWQPKSWNDILSAARAVKAHDPGVVPLNVYSGTPAGEASTMQGFEMLLYGTPNPGTLYNNKTNKWVAPSPGFQQTLQFIQTIYSQGLAEPASVELSGNIQNEVGQQFLPQNKLAIDLDGSWVPGDWISGGPSPWPQYSSALGIAPMPTENGQGSGKVSLSGGWTLSISSKSTKDQEAWNFIKLALNEKNSASYDIAAAGIAVRKDVAQDPKYLAGNAFVKDFTNLVPYTHYRPAYPVYPQISNAIQKSMDSVMNGQASPQQAQQTYVSTLKNLVKPNQIQSAG